MVFFGRPISSHLRALVRFPSFVGQIGRAVRIFRYPWRYITGYALARPIEERVVEFRDGMRIALSTHPGDLVTAFVVFAKRDYGEIPKGGNVLDIGANIGCFSLYAARAGARRVIAAEPSAESFATLVDNIHRNGYTDVIRPFQLAVTARAGDVVPFPTRSSPENRIGASAAREELADVQTTTLEEIVAKCQVDTVDLLKLDCEGAEYEIILNASRGLLLTVREIRLEYHDGRADDLIGHLEKNGFVVTRHRARNVDGSDHGDLWVRRVT